MSLVFIGTPEFAVPSLRRLVEAGHEVAAVITQPDRPSGRGRAVVPPPVKLAALDLGIPVHQPENLRGGAAVALLRELSPQVMVAVAYGQILRQEILDVAPRGVLNVHPSLLPRWRGASPIAGAILGGDEETGVSIMLMDAGMDSGPVLAQIPARIEPNDTTGSLTESLSLIGAELLVRTLPLWMDGQIEPKPQDSSLVTVTKLVRKEDGEIDWTRPAADIWRQVRACDPWPGARATMDGEAILIWKAWPLPGGSGAPGTIAATPDALTEQVTAAFGVETGDGVLAVLEAQRAGRKRLATNELLRGMPGLIGKRFDAA